MQHGRPSVSAHGISVTLHYRPECSVTLTTYLYRQYILYAGLVNHWCSCSNPSFPVTHCSTQLVTCVETVERTCLSAEWIKFYSKSVMSLILIKWKKALRETHTLHAGCSKTDPKIFAPPQTPFPGAQDRQNITSWNACTYGPSLVKIDARNFELSW